MSKVVADVVKLLQKWPRMVFATAMLVIGISVALSWWVPPAYESCGVIRIGQIVQLGQMYFTHHPDREIVDRRFRVHLDYTKYLEHADDLVSRLREEHRADSGAFTSVKEPYLSVVEKGRPGSRFIRYCGRAHSEVATLSFVKRVTQELLTAHDQMYQEFMDGVRTQETATEQALEPEACPQIPRVSSKRLPSNWLSVRSRNWE